MRVVSILFGLLLITASLVGIYRLSARSTPLPVLGRAPTFTLTDSSGRTFESSELLGKVWVGSFFFTSCPEVCPMVIAHLKQIAKPFENDPRVSFVSISVDPTVDTPEVLASFAKRHALSERNFHLLTGPREKIDHLLSVGFHVVDASTPSLHSTRLVVVDERGYIRHYVEGNTSESIATGISSITALLEDYNG